MEDDDDNNISDWTQGGAFADTAMGEFEEEVAEEGPIDDLGQALRDAQKDCESVKKSKKFERMLEDHKTLLHPDCKQVHKKQGSTLELLQWKATN